MSAMMISCIIPTHNRAALLPEAIESVLSQEPCGAQVELIVIDDASADNTPAVVAAYPQAQYVRTKQGSAGGSRNVGIERAKGEWLAFLDDDDVWLPHKLKRCCREIEAHPDCRFLFSDATICDRQLNPGEIWHGPDVSSGADLFTAFYGATLSVSVMLMHRSVFEQVGLFDLGVPRAEDQDLCLRIAAAGLPCYHIAEPLVLYRISNPMSPDLLQRAFRDTLTVLRRHAAQPAAKRLGWLGRQRVLLKVRGWYADQSVAAARHNAQQGQMENAAQLRKLALAISPMHYARNVLNYRGQRSGDREKLSSAKG